jgi:hypothetical protein
MQVIASPPARRQTVLIPHTKSTLIEEKKEDVGGFTGLLNKVVSFFGKSEIEL